MKSEQPHGLSGLTPKPAILDKAIAGGAHAGLIESLRTAGWWAWAIYNRVITEDLRLAAQKLPAGLRA